MTKDRRAYVCQECGKASSKWLGRCPECKAWNTLVEEVMAPAQAPNSLPAAGAVAKPVRLAEVQLNRGGEVRIRTGIGELDTVLGGGLVQGSLVLLGGDPGVGKSTLLLMALDSFGRKGLPVLYVSGEESLQQIKLRADRLGIGDTLLLLSETRFDIIEATVRQTKPMVVVIDSVQTVSVPELNGIPGSVGQVREVAHRAMVMAKGLGIATWLVGHVTKQGEIAGPKVLEHLVDTVLYFEGDGGGPLRMLRAVKNRFGPAGELGLFEMVEEGLREVPDASARLLAERDATSSGTAVLCAYEGSRPVLAEIQALVGRPGPSMPARHSLGTDRGRVSMLAAVLGKAGVTLYDRDLYVNVAGGMRIDEPAADLAIVAAIASSIFDKPVPTDIAFFGEVGLVGEIRMVSYPGIRLREAARHGFRRVVAPHKVAADAPAGITVLGVRSVREVIEKLKD